KRVWSRFGDGNPAPGERFANPGDSTGALMMAGLFLSLDGIDGTGKSTQCRLLADWLRGQGRDVVEAVDPGGTPLGQEVRQILLAGKHDLDQRCEALLFLASRAQLVGTVIRPALDRGAVVVCDRFLTSTVVYQGYAAGLDIDLLRNAGRLANGGDLEPDRVYVLDLPVGDAARRRGRGPDRIERRPVEYHERVRQGFLAEARRAAWRFRVIDASGDIDAIQAALRADVAGLLR
ncbi:MAG: dTMP kinase, partial [Gemmataceae bacterium]